MTALLQQMKRPFYFALASLALVLGFVGIFTPIMPTAPFIIVAAWGFAQSSPRFNRWLRSHPLFAQLIHDWETRRAVPLMGKICASVALSISLTVTTWMLGAAYWWASALLISVCVAVMAWVWRLPNA